MSFRILWCRGCFLGIFHISAFLRDHFLWGRLKKFHLFDSSLHLICIPYWLSAWIAAVLFNMYMHESTCRHAPTCAHAPTCINMHISNSYFQFLFLMLQYNCRSAWPSLRRDLVGGICSLSSAASNWSLELWSSHSNEALKLEASALSCRIKGQLQFVWHIPKSYD